MISEKPKRKISEYMPVSEIAATPTPTTIMMKIFNILISICILFLTQSCSRSSSRSLVTINDGGLLTKEPCGPPCFWGIIPGESTYLEVVKILENRQILSKCNTYKNESEIGSRSFTCDHILGFSFIPGKNVVESIGFEPDNITLEEIISTHGFPNDVLVLIGGTSQEHPPIVVMSIFYDQIQTRINLEDQEGREYNAQLSVLVSDVSYFDSSLYEQIKVGPMQKWEGYKTYKPSNEW